jgi:hypothetical protein
MSSVKVNGRSIKLRKPSEVYITSLPATMTIRY